MALPLSIIVTNSIILFQLSSLEFLNYYKFFITVLYLLYEILKIYCINFVIDGGKKIRESWIKCKEKEI